MTATLLRLVRGVLLTLSSIAALLVLFTLLQFNPRDAGLMAIMAAVFYALALVIRRASSAASGSS